MLLVQCSAVVGMRWRQQRAAAPSCGTASCTRDRVVADATWASPYGDPGAPLQAKAAVKQAALERKKQNREKSQVVQKVGVTAPRRRWEGKRAPGLRWQLDAAACAGVAVPHGTHSRTQDCAALWLLQITSSATVKKMLKGRKSRKLIQTADTN